MFYFKCQNFDIMLYLMQNLTLRIAFNIALDNIFLYKNVKFSHWHTIFFFNKKHQGILLKREKFKVWPTTAGGASLKGITPEKFTGKEHSEWAV